MQHASPARLRRLPDACIRARLVYRSSDMTDMAQLEERARQLVECKQDGAAVSRRRTDVDLYVTSTRYDRSLRELQRKCITPSPKHCVVNTMDQAASIRQQGVAQEFMPGFRLTMFTACQPISSQTYRRLIRTPPPPPRLVVE